MYDIANPHKNPNKPASTSPKWPEVQKLALDDSPQSDAKLQKHVHTAERRSIKLPIVRVARTQKTYGTRTVDQGRTVILDIVSFDNVVSRSLTYHVSLQFKANEAIYKAAKPGVELDTLFLDHKFSFTDRFADYHPKHVADLGVTAMIKIFAQMKNARRGHDTQGRLKRVRLDASSEGYTNYMAPMRIQRISKEVELLKRQEIERAEKAGGTPDLEQFEGVYTNRILRPATETFLTAEWDEMVPFPNSKPSTSSFPSKCVFMNSHTDRLLQLGRLDSMASAGRTMAARTIPCSAKLILATMRRLTISRKALAIRAVRLGTWDASVLPLRVVLIKRRRMEKGSRGRRLLNVNLLSRLGANGWEVDGL